MLARLQSLPRRTLGLLLIAVLLAVPLGALAVRSILLLSSAGRLRHAAAGRGLEASWRTLRFATPLTLRIGGLAVSRPSGGDTLLAAESIAVSLDPWSLLLLSPRPSRVEIAHAWLRAPAPAPGAAEPPPDEAPVPSRATAERLRRTADAIARLMLAPARRLPVLDLRDVEIQAARADESEASGAAALTIRHLELTRYTRGVRLAGTGRIALEQPVQFQFALDYGQDDRIAGQLWFGVPDSVRRTLDTLMVRVDGAVTQDRRRGVLELHDHTRVWIGSLPLILAGRMERRGPRASLRLAADGLTQALIERSIPAPLLGPLTQLSLEGSFDYRLALDLDVARPDSVALAVDVLPHGLALNADGTDLPILGLDEPFVALIHLPRRRTAVRELARDNPFYRPLEDIDSILVHAVVANEDGGFFRHRGFNLEAVRSAISENLRAGAYRRGAGTITMQLVRNLYLGHQRTLSRKAQEVVLAWVLEHLTGLSKQRVLEIYLNVVEWGPGVHGIGEAAHFYFNRDPGHLTPAEALFLSTLLPSPAKWRYRLGRDGALRASTRAQMHFIGRAMAAKGWLDPAALPAAEALEVEITGPARAELFPEVARADSGGAPAN
jgi:hypothetical protein